MLKFDEVENHLLFAVIYGIMYHKTDTENIKKEDAQEILGNDLYFDLLEIEPNTLPAQQIFIWFFSEVQINKVISKYSFFLRFFKRRNMYRFLAKKKVKAKNEVTRNLSACVVKKFDGYKH